MNKHVNETFFQHETPESAYVLGFLLADGHISKDGGCLELMNTKIEVVEYLRKLLGGGGFRVRHRVGRKDLYVLSLARKKIVSDLISIYGITHDKSYTGTWPKVKPENEKHLVRGFIDGDGHIDNGKNVYVEVASGSERLLEGFSDAVYRLINKRNNVTHNWRKNPVRLIYRVNVNGIYAKSLLEKVYLCGWGLKTAQAQKVVDRNILARSECNGKYFGINSSRSCLLQTL